MSLLAVIKTTLIISCLWFWGVICQYASALELNSPQEQKYLGLAAQYCQLRDPEAEVALLESTGEFDAMDFIGVLRLLFQEHQGDRKRPLNLLILVTSDLHQLSLVFSPHDPNPFTIGEAARIHICAPQNLSAGLLNRPVLSFVNPARSEAPAVSITHDSITLLENARLTLQNLIFSASGYWADSTLFAVKQGSYLHLINTVLERYNLDQSNRDIQSLVYMGRHSTSGQDRESDTPYFIMEGNYSALICHSEVKVMRAVDSIILIDDATIVSSGAGLHIDAGLMRLNGVSLWSFLEWARKILPGDVQALPYISGAGSLSPRDFRSREVMFHLTRETDLVMSHTQVYGLQKQLVHFQDELATLNPGSHDNQFFDFHGNLFCPQPSRIYPESRHNEVITSFHTNEGACKAVTISTDAASTDSTAVSVIAPDLSSVKPSSILTASLVPTTLLSTETTSTPVPPAEPMTTLEIISSVMLAGSLALLWVLCYTGFFYYLDQPVLNWEENRHR